MVRRRIDVMAEHEFPGTPGTTLTARWAAHRYTPARPAVPLPLALAWVDQRPFSNAKRGTSQLQTLLFAQITLPSGLPGAPSRPQQPRAIPDSHCSCPSAGGRAPAPCCAPRGCSCPRRCAAARRAPPHRNALAVRAVVQHAPASAAGEWVGALGAQAAGVCEAAQPGKRALVGRTGAASLQCAAARRLQRPCSLPPRPAFTPLPQRPLPRAAAAA